MNSQRNAWLLVFLSGVIAATATVDAEPSAASAPAKPNIVLVMTDDQGWGQTGYYGHPILRTPNLDAMAAGGLRLDRFYAAPNCSPTRATVLTGRAHDRCGVRNHGYPLRRQERTLAQSLQKAGYATGHFGKWHLNGHKGPGVPIVGDDDHSPGAFGFDEWLSVSNFFDRNPIMSRKGQFEEFEGESSEIIVGEALKFIGRQKAAEKPFLAVIWYGSPHAPWMAGGDDRAAFEALTDREQHHYGELAAMDRSIGRLRGGLREMGVADNTLVWYNSDNGGLKPFGPATVGGLRGWKNTIFEGGLRVPCIIEWPAVIRKPRISAYPAATVDIFPTLAAILDLPESDRLMPRDGVSLLPLFTRETGARARPIPFRHMGRAAWIDNDFKLLTENMESGVYQLYDLAHDPKESHDLAAERPGLLAEMRAAFDAWNAGVVASIAGSDYPEGRVVPAEPEPRAWIDDPRYAPYLDAWAARPEYSALIGKRKQAPPATPPDSEPQP